MGGVPAPTGLAFPSASEPNPIAEGLRGNGPMQVIMPQAQTPAAPSQPAAPSAPSSPSGQYYFLNATGAELSPNNSPATNAEYFAPGANIPTGFDLYSYFDPTTGMLTSNQQNGGLYQYYNLNPSDPTQAIPISNNPQSGQINPSVVGMGPNGGIGNGALGPYNYAQSAFGNTYMGGNNTIYGPGSSLQQSWNQANPNPLKPAINSQQNTQLL